MKRDKNIIMISHCILNQNSVVLPLARAAGGFKFINCLIKDGIGIIQLPCPEMRYLGLDREPMEKSEYDTQEYRTLCKLLFMPIMDEIKIYIKNEYNILGLIGISESPTCSISGIRGVFMEEVFKIFKENNFSPKCIEVPTDYDDERNALTFYQIIKKEWNFI